MGGAVIFAADKASCQQALSSLSEAKKVDHPGGSPIREIGSIWDLEILSDFLG